MTLFGGQCPEHDIIAPPDCMATVVHAELLHGFDVEDAENQTSTPEGAFAWLMIFANWPVVAMAAM